MTGTIPGGVGPSALIAIDVDVSGSGAELLLGVFARRLELAVEVLVLGADPAIAGDHSGRQFVLIKLESIRQGVRKRPISYIQPIPRGPNDRLSTQFDKSP